MDQLHEHDCMDQLHEHDCHQNVTEPQATEHHIKSTHLAIIQSMLQTGCMVQHTLHVCGDSMDRLSHLFAVR